jgi:hypothetical protein
VFRDVHREAPGILEDGFTDNARIHLWPALGMRVVARW